jgi:hypothetical protein
VEHFAAARWAPVSSVNVAWLLNQPFPVVAVVSLPALLTRPAEYERASQMLLEESDLQLLRGGC